jgi:oligopeptide transport system substrate-binding protein
MRRVTRGTWAVAVTTALALASAACGGGGDGGSSSGGSSGVVRASWGEPQNPLEPANTNEVQGGKVLDMIFTGLVRYNPDTAKAENAMAQSISTKDQKTFTIKVKKGWKFQDGTPVNARSFVDAWNYGALLSNKQINSYFFQYIDGYDKVHPATGKATAKTLSGLKVKNDHTFTVTLSQKFSQFPKTLGYAAFSPLPKSFFNDHGKWLAKPIGNGPYKIDSYTRGQEMKLSEYKKYKGSNKAQNDGVDLKVYTDNNTAYTDLQAGNLDVVDDIPASQLANAKQDLNGRYINQPAGIIQTVSFPLYQKQWKGEKARKVRMGLSMAINRKQITQKIYHGTRTPATDLTSPVLGKAGGYRKGLCGSVCTYDPHKAKQLIQSAGGLPGGKITITSNVDTGSHRQWMDAACNSINNALGNNHACTVNPVPTFAKFRQQVSGKKMTGMFRTGWQMDYPLIQDFLQPIYYTNASSNDAGYSNPQFDKLVNKANASSDPVPTFVDAEKIVLHDLPAIPLWYQNGTAGYSTRVSNVKLNPFSVPVFTDIKVKS